MKPFLKHLVLIAVFAGVLLPFSTASAWSFRDLFKWFRWGKEKPVQTEIGTEKEQPVAQENDAERYCFVYVRMKEVVTPAGPDWSLDAARFVPAVSHLVRPLEGEEHVSTWLELQGRAGTLGKFLAFGDRVIVSETLTEKGSGRLIEFESGNIEAIVPWTKGIRALVLESPLGRFETPLDPSGSCEPRLVRRTALEVTLPMAVPEEATVSQDPPASDRVRDASGQPPTPPPGRGATVPSFEGGEANEEVYRDPLRADCFPVNEDIDIGGSVEWQSSVEGGSGMYRYVWAGDEDLSGTRETVQKVYKRLGMKKAVLTVSDGIETQAFPCTPLRVSEAEAKPTPPLDVFLSVNGVQRDLSVVAGSPVQLSWTSSGVIDHCRASWTSVGFSGTGSVTVYPASDEVYTVTCYNRNDPEETISDSREVTVVSLQKPPRILGISVASAVYAGRDALWKVTVSDEDSPFITIQVDWGDDTKDVFDLSAETLGETLVEEVSHTYETPDTYSLVVTASDQSGGTARISRSVLVRPAPVGARQPVSLFERKSLSKWNEGVASVAEAFRGLLER